MTQGYLSRSLTLNNFWLDSYVSIHMVNGTPAFALLLFMLQLVWALGMLVGYRTRLMTALSWYWQISLQMRCPLVLHNGDVYVRMLLFWGMFMPLGRWWSFDRALSRCHTLEERLQERRERAAGRAGPPLRFNAGILGHYFQILFVYSVSVIHKSQRGWQIWFVEGSAVYWALNSIPCTRPFHVSRVCVCVCVCLCMSSRAH